MSGRMYCFISGLIFAAVAGLHIWRLKEHWVVVLGPWTMPMDVSWIGLSVAGVLSFWSFQLLTRK